MAIVSFTNMSVLFNNAAAHVDEFPVLLPGLLNEFDGLFGGKQGRICTTEVFGTELDATEGGDWVEWAPTVEWSSACERLCNDAQVQFMLGATCIAAKARDTYTWEIYMQQRYGASTLVMVRIWWADDPSVGAYVALFEMAPGENPSLDR